MLFEHMIHQREEQEEAHCEEGKKKSELDRHLENTGK